MFQLCSWVRRGPRALTQARLGSRSSAGSREGRAGCGRRELFHKGIFSHVWS